MAEGNRISPKVKALLILNCFLSFSLANTVCLYISCIFAFCSYL